MSDSDLRLDGNAAGGVLGELFAFEMTQAQIICAGCQMSGAVGSLMVYASPMGTVVRCPGCDTVLIRVARTGQRYWLDMRGAQSVQIATPGT
jgi:hypothetical protein